MYALFSFLFGPFSCSRTRRRPPPRTITPSFAAVKLLALCRRKRSNTCAARGGPSEPLPAVPVSQTIPSETEQERGLVNEDDLTNKDAEVLNVLIESLEVEANTQQAVGFDHTSTTTTVVHVTETAACIRSSRTYCDNKHKCMMPSHEAVSDAVRWRQWIHTHVPGFVLFIIKLSWLLYNNIVVSATVVTVGYFSFVAICGYEFDSTWLAELGNLHRHGFNSLVAIIDLVLLAYPVCILHFVYTASYGWIYALVTFFYWMYNTKENIVYEQIDYNKPFTVMVYYTLLTMSTFFMQMLHFFAYQVKLALREKYLRCRLNCAKKDSVDCV